VQDTFAEAIAGLAVVGFSPFAPAVPGATSGCADACVPSFLPASPVQIDYRMEGRPTLLAVSVAGSVRGYHALGTAETQGLPQPLGVSRPDRVCLFWPLFCPGHCVDRVWQPAGRSTQGLGHAPKASPKEAGERRGRTDFAPCRRHRLGNRSPYPPTTPHGLQQPRIWSISCSSCAMPRWVPPHAISPMAMAQPRLDPFRWRHCHRKQATRHQTAIPGYPKPC
jgi:hypothetical protein